MKRIVLGNKDDNINYEFRETCFGIVKKNDLFYITKKRNDYSLIGGGIEDNESFIDCLRREFREEAGLNIINIEELCIVDCYWYTRSEVYMNSLSNIFIVDVSDEEFEPLENDSMLVKCDKDFLMDHIHLPYQIEGLNEYFNKGLSI